MKKYVIRNADGSAQDVMPALHSSRKEALLTILDYATKVVEDNKDDSCIKIPTDYIVEEIEEMDVNERIKDFRSAKMVIGPARFIFAEELVHLPTAEINAGHIEALNALNQLFTIAEAWNKEDGFVPDFSNEKQDKWFPWFRYNKNAAEFVCVNMSRIPGAACAALGSRLCFKTSERAKQFGEQFSDLYNKVFL